MDPDDNGTLLHLPPLWRVTFANGRQVTVRARTELGARLNAGAALVRDQLSWGDFGDTPEGWMASFQDLPQVVQAERVC